MNEETKQPGCEACGGPFEPLVSSQTYCLPCMDELREMVDECNGAIERDEEAA